MNYKILVVDDESEIADLIEMYLQGICKMKIILSINLILHRGH